MGCSSSRPQQEREVRQKRRQAAPAAAGTAPVDENGPAKTDGSPTTAPTELNSAGAPTCMTAAAAAHEVAAAAAEAPLAAAAYGVLAEDPGEFWKEQERLQALHSLGVSRQPTGPRFGAITNLLRTVFDASHAHVVLLEEEHLVVVPDTPEDDWAINPRYESTCKWVVEPAEHEMLIIEDMSTDMRFNRSRWIAGPAALRFYASAPLVSSDRGMRYGTLCVIDGRPRHFQPEQYQMLLHLAEVVVRELEGASLLRLRQLELDAMQSGLRRLVRGIDCFKEGILLCDVDQEGWPVQFANQASSTLTGLAQEQAAGAGFWQLFSLVSGSASCGSGGAASAASMADVQLAIRKRQPFTVTCTLQAGGASGACKPAGPQAAGERSSAGDGELDSSSSGPTLGSLDGRWLSAAAAGGEQAGSGVGGGGNGGGGAAISMVLSGRASLDTVFTARHVFGGESISLAVGSSSQEAPTFTVTFTPASAPEFRPDEPAIGIPQVISSDDAMSSSGGGSDAPAASDRYWFATLQPAAPPAAPAGSVRLSSNTAVCGSGSTDSAAVTATRAGSLAFVQPEALQDVQLGPLLGVGASGRTYRGSWHGSSVAVKIINIWGNGSQQANGGGSRSGTCDDSGHTAGPIVSGMGATISSSEGSGMGVSSFDGMTAAASSGGGSAAASCCSPLLEAVLSRSLAHPNIVPTHAWGVSNVELNENGELHRQIWIVQTLCSRGTLARAVDSGLFQDPVTKGPHLHFILLTAAEVSAALVYLHKVGVVHGDLSGNNILLSPASKDARKFTAMVADFGLSRSTFESSSVAPSGTFGTVSHMPPEVLANDEVSPSTDAFSFGVCLWEMMSGRRAWRGMGPLQIINAVTMEHRALCIADQWPPDIKDLIKSCFRLDPTQRPTAVEILRSTRVMLQQFRRRPQL